MISDRNKYKELVIREQKRNFYQKKNDLQKHNPKKMWETLGQLVSDKKKKQKIDKVEINGEIITTIEDAAEVLNKYFVDSINGIIENIDNSNLSTTRDNHSSFLPQNKLDTFRLIDFKELEDVVFALPDKGSTDDITAEFLKSTFLYVKKPLLNIINTSLETGQIPSLLKESTVVPIQKIKGSVKATDLRPINMLATIEKLLERIVYQQLIEYVQENNILMINQSGYRKYHSCETAFQNILYDWKFLLNDDYAIVAVFLDFKAGV